MILTPHLLLGAAIAAKISNPFLILPLAFLSHYFLDLLPHKEYSVENIFKKNWKKSLPDFIKVGVDFSSGIVLISIFSSSELIVYAGALLAILPDGITFFGFVFSNKFSEHNDDFHKKIHLFVNKKIPAFWGVFSQIATSLTAIFFLL